MGFWTLLLGYVSEAIGLGLAIAGLAATWRANADGRPFLPAWVPRRRRDAFVTISSGDGGSLSAAEAHPPRISVTPAPELTIERRIEALEASVDRGAEDIEALMGRVHSAEAALGHLRGDLESAATRATAAANDFAKGLAVDGLRRAVVGLGFVALGLILQGVPTLVAAWK